MGLDGCAAGLASSLVMVNVVFFFFFVPLCVVVSVDSVAMGLDGGLLATPFALSGAVAGGFFLLSSAEGAFLVVVV
jgi:hypothetical protein